MRDGRRDESVEERSEGSRNALSKEASAGTVDPIVKVDLILSTSYAKAMNHSRLQTTNQPGQSHHHRNLVRNPSLGCLGANLWGCLKWQRWTDERDVVSYMLR